MAQEIFERMEQKYLLNTTEYLELIPELVRYMEADAYGKYSVSNVYFDTEDFRLIRESMEKPVYKEKLRLRCYGEPSEDGTVFTEIKKKYDGVVYKRRIPMRLKEAQRYLYGGIKPDLSCSDFIRKQIFSEIDYMKERYDLKPAAFISYDRIAFSGKEDPELRVTFDNNIRARSYDLDLRNGRKGLPLLQKGMILMEVKIPGSMPLWMCRVFEKISRCQTTFSKYGEFYEILSAARENKEGGKICA